MRELFRLHARGENLYYTPRSERMHHVLLDDLSDASLRQMIADGYRPAVVMESSPGKLQAILNVPKLGRPDDQDVGQSPDRRPQQAIRRPQTASLHPSTPRAGL